MRWCSCDRRSNRHRGSLDPLAFWLQRGWSEREFFAFTDTRLEEHYLRYAAVLHLVTCADGAPWAYTRWPDTHRPEAPEDALRLDSWLQQIWGGHPHYVRLDNVGRDWPMQLFRNPVRQYCQKR